MRDREERTILAHEKQELERRCQELSEQLDTARSKMVRQHYFIICIQVLLAGRQNGNVCMYCIIKQRSAEESCELLSQKASILEEEAHLLRQQAIEAQQQTEAVRQDLVSVCP